MLQCNLTSQTIRENRDYASIPHLIYILYATIVCHFVAFTIQTEISRQRTSSYLVSCTVLSWRVEFINLDRGSIGSIAPPSRHACLAPHQRQFYTTWVLVLASTYAQQQANNARHKREEGGQNVARGIHVRRNLKVLETAYEVNDTLSKEKATSVSDDENRKKPPHSKLQTSVCRASLAPPARATSIATRVFKTVAIN